VSGSLLLGKNIAAVNVQGALVSTVFSEAGKQIAEAMTEGTRSFLKLNDAQLKAIADMKRLGFTAQEIATALRIPLRVVEAEVFSLGDNLKSLAKSIPDTIISAFTGGGGLAGALKAIGVELGKVFATAITDSVNRNLGQGGSGLSGTGLIAAGGLGALSGGMTLANGGTKGQAVMSTVGAGVGAGVAFSAASMAAGEGAAIGASIATGAATMGIGLAVVGAIIAIKAMMADKGADIMRDIGSNFGSHISQGLSDTIKKDVEDNGWSEQAAEIAHLSDIIKEAGGLTAQTIGPMTSRFRDLFSMIATGQMSVANGAAIMDANWSTFTTAATSGVGVLAGKMVELIRLDKEAGTNSKAIGQYTSGQITSNVFGGLTAGLTPGVAANDALVADRKSLADLTAQLNGKEIQDLAKIEDLKKHMANADAAHAADYQRQIDALMGGQDSLISKIALVNKDIEAQQKALTTSALTSQGAASAAAGAILAGIGELQRQGVDFMTALTQAKPAIEALQKQLTQTGFDGGAAFAELSSYVTLASDAIAGPALKAAAGFGQALVGLHNSGLLTQDMFSGLAGQIAHTRDALVAQGKDGGAVLHLLAPQLQQIWEIQKQTGMAVDDTTQALLDEASKAGLIGAKFEGPQQQMIDALGNIADILKAIGKALGADLPKDAETGATGVTNALNQIPGEKKIRVIYTGDAPPDQPVAPDKPTYASSGGRVLSSGVQYFGTSGIVKPGVQYFSDSGIVMPRWKPRGTDTVPIMATPGELLLNVAQQTVVADTLRGAVHASSQPPSQPLELTLNDTINIGGENLGIVTRKFIFPEITEILRSNRGGSTTDLRQVLRIT
jgi:hypothetical protein